MSNIIQVTGLKKTFRLSARQQKLERTNSRLKVAVNDLSFSANEGEIFGLLGANGAGKTTTLRMLATLIRPDEGTAVLDGADIVAEPERVRRKIGFLTGELKLEEYFTPNYLFDFFCELHGVPENLRAERKRMLFEKFGIDSFAEVKVGNLSTGMKQKVSLVIALVHDPKIIIFDEPTNGLDVLTAKVVTDFLAELRAQGKTLPNMAAALVGSALGAALLLLLCGRMGLGAFGAGMAMLAREAATLAVLLAYTLRHGELIRPSLRRVRLTRAVFSEIMRSGLPTLLRQGATSVSAALLSRVSAGFGAPVLAGMGLCARAIMPFTSAVIGFGQGFQPVCGAAFGAKQTARCQEAYRFCQRVAIAFSLAAGLAFFVFAPALAARFAPDAQAAEAARRALRLQSIAFPAQSAVILMTMLTQAMGITLRASLVATSRQALFFLPLLAVLPRLFGLWGLLACQSASDLAALGFSLALTRRLRGSSSARCGCSDARTVCRSHPRSSS